MDFDAQFTTEHLLIIDVEILARTIDQDGERTVISEDGEATTPWFGRSASSNISSTTPGGSAR